MEDKKIVLFGAGKIGKEVINFLGSDKIGYILDNNEKLNGKMIKGIPVKLFSEVSSYGFEEYDIVISVSEKYQSEIESCLKYHKINYFKNINQYLLKKKYCSSNWEKYRDIHKGKDCFLIGSGPSLRIEDLNMLAKKNVVCFAANKIFKLFDMTEWRPDYYISTDRRILKFYQKEILSLNQKEMFIAYYTSLELRNFYSRIENTDNIKLFSIRESQTENRIEFSNSPADYIIEGKTVMYAMMQMAAFMGFSKMFLLGVDFSYNDKTGYDKQGKDHFCKDYIMPGEEVLISPQEYCLKSFYSAEEYSRLHNFRIFNATRGGKLEVFERINFDKIMGMISDENN